MKGIPRGLGNFGDMMSQAKKMQDQMAVMHEELARQEVTGTAGGGMVTVTMNGKQEPLRVKIDPQVVSADDVEMLEDLVLAAFNEARKNSNELMEAAIKKVTGGLPIPPGLL